MASKDKEMLVHWSLVNNVNSPWNVYAACDWGLRVSPSQLTDDAEAITCPVCREVCAARAAATIERSWGKR